MTVGDKKSLWGSLGLKEIAQQRTNLEGDPSPDKGSDLFVEGSWLTSDLAQVEWHLILSHQWLLSTFMVAVLVQAISSLI